MKNKSLHFYEGGAIFWWYGIYEPYFKLGAWQTWLSEQFEEQQEIVLQKSKFTIGTCYFNTEINLPNKNSVAYELEMLVINMKIFLDRGTYMISHDTAHLQRYNVSRIIVCYDLILIWKQKNGFDNNMFE